MNQTHFSATKFWVFVCLFVLWSNNRTVFINVKYAGEQLDRKQVEQTFFKWSHNLSQEAFMRRKKRSAKQHSLHLWIIST